MRQPSATALTLVDWDKRVSPNGGVDDLVDMLHRANPVLTPGNWTVIHRDERIHLADDVDWCVQHGWRF